MASSSMGKTSGCAREKTMDIFGTRQPLTLLVRIFGTNFSSVGRAVPKIVGTRPLTWGHAPWRPQTTAHGGQAWLTIPPGTKCVIHTHIHNHFTALLDFVRDYLGEPTPER